MNAAALGTRTARLLATRSPLSVQPLAGGDICDAYRVTLPGGSPAGTDTGVFVKTLDAPPPGFFAAEADGLALLRATGAVRVPEVLAVEEDLLVLEWLEPAAPDAAQAERLGRDLAALHATPADRYGTAGPRYLGTIPLSRPAEPVRDPADWPMFHVEHRLLPLLRRAVDAGGIGHADARAVELLCDRIGEAAGPPQPPATVHGDLWSGNIQWSSDGRPRLIDPAAQGGHPETDLALLELFGCPHLDRLLGAYTSVRPIPGRAARVPLHQLQHLLVHAALFGGAYGRSAGAAARAALP
ncbi:fructosamine kinase family protein [Streptomyces sp. RFCAC02]|uniref:fructosamine kinase family protein n=1 Tax=Streptomyces sp. RFCAC02 TaxID=2499143 RepID=UPI0010208D70|nr:fructosamine kinase family protein [Streptomyces sp. RFCAC02]